jgi:hypothetical protein
LTAPKTFKLSFRDVFVDSPKAVFFLAGDDAGEKKDIRMTWVLRWAGAWGNQRITIRATSLTIATKPEPAALLMGIDGVIARWGSGAITYEIVDQSDDGPQYYGDLREIRTIAGKAYVVGMGRTVYRCDAAQRWSRIDQGVRESNESDADVGFNSIDGVAESRLVAVGFGGEIWTFRSRRWSAEDSPTNVTLNKVVCASEKRIVACGQKGVVLLNDGRAWRVVEHSETEEDFWGAALFKGAIYLSTLNGLYRLRGRTLETVKMRSVDPKNPVKTGRNVSYFRLHTDGETLWSIGTKTAMFSSDGEQWAEAPYK